MIYLHSPSCRDVTTPPIKVIQPYTAVVHREDGGTWELTATMSADELGDLVTSSDQAILSVMTPEGRQPFRMRYIERDGGILTVKAPHVYHDGDGCLIGQIAVTGATIDTVAAQLTAQIMAARPYTGADPWALSVATGADKPSGTHDLTLLLEPLTDVMGKIREAWGCYIRPDGFGVTLTARRGDPSGYTIRYGVNMLSATVSHDWTDVATAILPTGEDEIAAVSPVYISTPYSAGHYVARSYSSGIDRQQIKDDHPGWTDDQVDAAYRNAVRASIIRQAGQDLQQTRSPAINYTVEGYVDAAIRIGDTVRCIDTRYNLDLTAACVAYDYNAVTGAYDAIQFGDFAKSLRALRPKA